MNTSVKSGLLGLAVADALGVPVELFSREELKAQPVSGMLGYGTHQQPPGTWSDDTSLTLCLMDSLIQCGKPDYKDIISRFQAWLEHGEYSSRGSAFGVGHATRKAILLAISGHEPLDCGGTDFAANGNGSLMRILPMAFYLSPLIDSPRPLEESTEEVHRISSLTHAHPISKMACGIYVIIIDALLCGRSLMSAMSMANRYYKAHPEFVSWLEHFSRVFDLSALEKSAEKEINSSTYVVNTLEAALWAFLTTDSYRDCVLKAINLGGDTDSVGAVAGGLAGVAYGTESIPGEWVDTLARRDFLEEIIEGFDGLCPSK